MEKITLNAYLLFDNNCREAMAFYQGIFGVVSDQFGINWMVNISSKPPNEKPGL